MATIQELRKHLRSIRSIAKKYGGLANLGEKLSKAENFELALDELIWLIVLLANQPILIHNLQNPTDKKELLDQETVELLTTPFELAGFKEALMDALLKGTKREVESEESKNAQSGRKE